MGKPIVLRPGSLSLVPGDKGTEWVTVACSAESITGETRVLPLLNKHEHWGTLYSSHFQTLTFRCSLAPTRQLRIPWRALNPGEAGARREVTLGTYFQGRPVTNAEPLCMQDLTALPLVPHMAITVPVWLRSETHPGWEGAGTSPGENSCLPLWAPPLAGHPVCVVTLGHRRELWAPEGETCRAGWGTGGRDSQPGRVAAELLTAQARARGPIPDDGAPRQAPSG